ncbi:2-phospho-L-lactate guanylyltransferase [Natrialbaceae archaeon GCM10025810]|uniref:2-phospho-L-lactate guanylyltransferase n=1 Tax=Halovalidus salilacus TaxID=3075124 RepID=UPI003612F3AF
MHVVVPFAATDPKTRLSGVLTPEERSAIARAMLEDVASAIAATGYESTILSTAPLSGDLDTDPDGPISVTVDDRPLSIAVNAVLESRLAGDGDGDPVAVVMADLALATPIALEGLFSTPGDVVLVPGRGGGTNAFVARHPDFRVDYHGASYLDHRRIAGEVGADVETVDSYRLSTDVDEPEDLVEVLLHGTGRVPTLLYDLGFSVDEREGRVRASRREE